MSLLFISQQLNSELLEIKTGHSEAISQFLCLYTTDCAITSPPPQDSHTQHSKLDSCDPWLQVLRLKWRCQYKNRYLIESLNAWRAAFDAEYTPAHGPGAKAVILPTFTIVPFLVSIMWGITAWIILIVPTAKMGKSYLAVKQVLYQNLWT